MITIKQFVKNIKKYLEYATYSAKAELKSEVANSYLNWIWWILEPICMMLIYIFVVEIVFKSKEPNFPVFVFIGITAWNYFNKMLTTSVRLVKNKKSIISKIYLPKYILILEKSFVFGFKACISFALILVLMIIFKVDFTLYLLNFIIIFALLYILTFGLCCIIMHFGTYIEDLTNVCNIGLKFVFYFSGIFYNISTKVPVPFNNLLMKLNPIAFIINEFRKAFMYAQFPDVFMIACWFIIGIIISAIGIKLIHKYEKSYVKVI